MFSALLLLFACGGPEGHVVVGTVVERTAADEVVLDHEAIEGLMGPMVMPFHVEDPALIADLKPGDRVEAQLVVGPSGGLLRSIRVTGHTAAPVYDAPAGPAPLRVGQVLPSFSVTLADGSTTVLGEGQGRPTALTFLYTRCPMPEFCPATVAKYQALQAAVGPDIRLLALTLDPAYDTPEVLGVFGHNAGADPAIWQLGTTPQLADLALYAGLSVLRPQQGVEIQHGIRVLVLDGKGALIQRYDDHEWPVSRVVQQLRTGAPLGL